MDNTAYTPTQNNASDDYTPLQDDITSNMPIASFTLPTISFQHPDPSSAQALSAIPIQGISAEKLASLNSVFKKTTD